MNKQNVTLSLPKSLLKKVKVMAVRSEKSLSEFLKQALEEKVREATGYKKARQRQLRLIKKGIDLGTEGHISISQEKNFITGNSQVTRPLLHGVVLESSRINHTLWFCAPRALP